VIIKSTVMPLHDPGRELIWALMRTLIKMGFISDSGLMLDANGVCWIDGDSDGSQFIDRLMKVHNVK